MNTKKIVSFAVAAALIVSIGCGAQKKYVAKGETTAAKLKQLFSDINDKKWEGPMNNMKEKITDQLSRVENGMKSGKITDGEAEEIVASAENVMSSIDEMTEKMSSWSGGNGPGGGMGGPPSGGMGGPPSGGMGGPPSGGMGGPPSGGMGGPPSGGNPSMEFPELKQLKTIINDLYSNTITASAGSVTTTAAPEK
jgi:hypothetical protein